MTNSCPYSGSVSVTSDSCENQILLEPTSTGTTPLAGPASFLSCPPGFFSRSPSPHQPFLALARSMISSEVGGELALPRAASPRIPASSSPPTASPDQPNMQHLTSGGLGSQGASHLSPCTFQGLAFPALHPTGSLFAHRWVPEATRERSKAAKPELSLENDFVGWKPNENCLLLTLFF